ncbi:hypothetical protein GS399_18605 [Pedobacter sp. HMF7647]|uniref:PepSY domain-containing protein n=1 Tax=Hufsiella arboris TaxID=2695275 RepID=A0A7K1YEG4_9SPHI|nr:hypothetical protein [Hufsiella arboris]MXV52986.1 hypothetical protein [Hufsiella arboris]
MKKLAVLAVAVLLTSARLFAQDDVVITGSKKAGSTVSSEEITKAIQEKFPNAKSVKYYEVPASGVENGWAVSKDYNLTSGEDVGHYAVSFYQNNAKYYGLFDKDGKVEMYKYKRSEATLPDAVKQSLRDLAKGDYKSWKIDKSTYYKTEQEGGSGKEYYEVTASKGSTKKKVYIAPDGKVIKIK